MKHISRALLLTMFISLLGACNTIQKKSSASIRDPEFTPKLKKPEVRRVWVPDQIVGDEYISGHWKFVLEKNSVWSN